MLFTDNPADTVGITEYGLDSPPQSNVTAPLAFSSIQRRAIARLALLSGFAAAGSPVRSVPPAIIPVLLLDEGAGW